MSVQIANYNFEGPYTNIDSLADLSGVYVVLDQRSNGLFVLDVGESSEVRTRIANHDRKGCWTSNSSGIVKVAVHYTPGLHQSGRQTIEQQLRQQYRPTCGDR